MMILKDRLVDELRNESLQLFGRMPVGEWNKPERVTLLEAEPRLSDALGGFRRQPPRLDFVMRNLLDDGSPKPRLVRPREGILDEFLSLSSSTPATIRSFAEKYGPLLIYCKVEEAKESHNWVVTEECEVWTYFASCLRALLHIAARYRTGLAADDEDWGLIGRTPSAMKYEKPGPIDIWNPLVLRGEEAWMVLVHFVRRGSRGRAIWLRLLNCLLALGRVRPWMISEGPSKEARPRLVFSSPNLLSYLALQVCLLAAKQDGFAMCSYCQKPYVPRRAPKSGQRAYCKECRDAGVPVRVAQRNRRARLRGDQ
jgi:hypothetical protein